MKNTANGIKVYINTIDQFKERNQMFSLAIAYMKLIRNQNHRFITSVTSMMHRLKIMIDFFFSFKKTDTSKTSNLIL